tara:strand:- start:2671 stop:2952 length:282 start_codon:yes stop_codon:yes gene_type:complete
MHVGRSDYRSFGERVTAILEWKPGVEHFRLLLSRFLGREVEFTALALLPLHDSPRQDSLPQNLSFFGLLHQSLLSLLSLFQNFRFGSEAMVVA